MNSGRAKRARREVGVAQRNVRGRIEKLNWLLCAGLSNTDLRRSLGEHTEIDFPLVVKLLAMVLSPRCGAMQSLQTRRAERCERNNDESAYRRSDSPVRLDSAAHIRSIRFNLLGRKWLCPRPSADCMTLTARI
jgi:hypothetical protein